MKTFFQILIILSFSPLLACAPKSSHEIYNDDSEEIVFFDDSFYLDEEEDSGMLEKFNRATFSFNDWAFRNVVNPISKGYRFMMPDLLETAIENVFGNVQTIMNVPYGLLQGKWMYAATEFGEGMIESTVGIFGIIEILNENPGHNEDLGQTLAHWGVPEGPTIVVPFWGPKTILDFTSGIVGGYLSPQGMAFDGEFFIPLKLEEELNNWPKKYEAYEMIWDRSPDEFSGLLNAYEENRKKKVRE